MVAAVGAEKGRTEAMPAVIEKINEDIKGRIGCGNR
jgi:hypothetical protein